MSLDFELDVLVNGSAARVFKHEGKAYIEGKVGSTFTVRIKNNTPRRALAVLTVDGLSVMDGSEGSFNSGGYIIPAWGSVKVPGWRLTDDNVASFEFTYPGNSYASSKGKGSNLGVIGCAFFFEEENNIATFSFSTSGTSKEAERGGFNVNPNNSAVYLASNSSNANMNVFSLSASGLGTGFGDKKTHKVEAKRFERASVAPIEVLTVFYDTKDGLRRRGIDVDYRSQIAPSAFPQEKSQKYCEPPKGWLDEGN